MATINGILNSLGLDKGAIIVPVAQVLNQGFDSLVLVGKLRLDVIYLQFENLVLLLE
jgi:hypothetical protein